MEFFFSSWELSKLDRKTCFVKLTLIENSFSFTMLLQNRMWQNWHKFHIWQLKVFLLFLFLCLWSTSYIVSDLFQFQNFEVLLAFDLTLAIPNTSFIQDFLADLNTTPLSISRKGKIYFKGFGDFSLVGQPESIFYLPQCENLHLLKSLVDSWVPSVLKSTFSKDPPSQLFTFTWDSFLLYFNRMLFPSFKLLSLKQWAQNFLKTDICSHNWANTSENQLFKLTKLLPPCYLQAQDFSALQQIILSDSP